MSLERGEDLLDVRFTFLPDLPGDVWKFALEDLQGIAVEIGINLGARAVVIALGVRLEAVRLDAQGGGGALVADVFRGGAGAGKQFLLPPDGAFPEFHAKRLEALADAAGDGVRGVRALGVAVMFEDD